MFEKMNTSLTKYPIKGLIAIMFLGKGIKYVMTGNFQRNRLEGHLLTAQLWQLLYVSRTCPKLSSNYNALNFSLCQENLCCKDPLTENEIDQLDNCFSEATYLNEIERSTLYYISGYVCHKENLQSASATLGITSIRIYEQCFL